MTLSEKYLIEALDNYPFNLPQVLESLNYALSYDSENAMALGLLGQFYSEQFLQYEKAKEYFAQALAIDIHCLKVYPYYIDTLIYNQDYEEALKLIEFAMTIKGIDKAIIWFKKATLFEYTEKYKKSIQCHKKSKLFSLNCGFNQDADDAIKRLESKIKTKKEKPIRVKKFFLNQSHYF